MPSSLQSNWNASPYSKLSGTNARSRFARVGPPESDEVGQRGVAAPVALRLQLHQQCLGRAPVLAGSVGIGLERRHQRSLERRELARLALLPVLGLHPEPALSHFLTVFLDKPVRRAISLYESPSRNFMRRTLPIMSMVITSRFAPAEKFSRNVIPTLVNFGPELPSKWSDFGRRQHANHFYCCNREFDEQTRPDRGHLNSDRDFQAMTAACWTI